MRVETRRASSVSAPQMLVLVREPTLLLDEFFDIRLDGQVGGIC